MKDRMDQPREIDSLKQGRMEKGGYRLSTHRLRFYDHAVDSVLVRGLDGSIRFWNRAAEHHYGWSRKEAVGHVSHDLLNTVFPCPLSEINRQLLSEGYWEGELIHTISDGVRVKVLSRWELSSNESEQVPTVVEINKVSETICPENAHFELVRNLPQRILRLLWIQRYWWFVPLLIVLGGLEILVEVTDNFAVAPPPD